MARKKETVEKTIRLKQSELKQAIIDASRHKANAAAHSGFHGQAVKQFCERTSFDRTVFGWLRKLHDMNDQMKVQAIVRQFLMGIELLDWNLQGDLFDVQDEIANKATFDVDDKGDADGANVVAFQKDAVPLGEVAKTLTQNNVKAAAKRERRAAAAEAAAPKKRGRPAKEAAPVPEGSFTMEAPSWQREDRMPGPGAEDDEAWEKQ